MDAGVSRSKKPKTGEAAPKFITMRIICSACGNLNRAARRACKRCNHTGFEGERQIEQKPDQELTLGGVMPDMAKVEDRRAANELARTLTPSKP